MASGWGAVGGGAWNSGGTAGWGASTNQEEPAHEQQGYVPPAPEPVPVAPSVSSNAFGAAGGAFGAAPSQSFNNSSQTGGASNAQLQVKEEQLKKREAQLAAREKQLKEYEKKLMDAGHIKPKNWPSRCYPILHHDIANEIPERSRRPVREAYMAWLALVACLCFNFFCACVMLGSDDSKRVSSWFLALLYLIIGIPAGFWLWYWKLYNGAKADSTLSFLGFFVWFAIHTAFCIYAAIAPSIGWGKWAFAGFVTAMQAFDYGNFQGIIYLVGGGCWAAEALFSFWIMRDVWYFFRGQGGVEQVQKEAALAAFRAQLQTSASNRV